MSSTAQQAAGPASWTATAVALSAEAGAQARTSQPPPGFLAAHRATEPQPPQHAPGPRQPPHPESSLPNHPTPPCTRGPATATITRPWDNPSWGPHAWRSFRPVPSPQACNTKCRSPGAGMGQCRGSVWSAGSPGKG